VTSGGHSARVPSVCFEELPIVQTAIFLPRSFAMLWERKPASPGTETERPELIPVNMRKPTKAWTDGIAIDSNARRPSETVLGRSVVLKGELTLHEDLLIEGQFEGNLSDLDQRVTIGPEAKVKSDICAREAIVLGSVQGNISAQQRIEIRKSGRAVGDLVAPGILIESGAYFKGKIEILNHGANESHDLSPRSDEQAVSHPS
jgi:cytoskeletal protein CcmA (bactofilin family)